MVRVPEKEKTHRTHDHDDDGNDKTVVAPLEALCAKLERVRANPLAAVQLGDEEWRRRDLRRRREAPARAERGVGKGRAGGAWKLVVSV